ncbi:MAG: type II toxin-antitoxin system RelE/ParE family toxin [Planctomycetaceae bacterium]|nr:type II toxin-antitoxin system RelE/ParE family toxin [Planctomycetaceae bacterium]
MRRELIRTTAFIRAAKRHVKRRPQAADEIATTLEMMSADVFDTRLRTHKLKGDLEGVWTCSAGYDLRILFEIGRDENAEAILLLAVGTHDEVY